MGRKITTLPAQKKSGPERYGPERRGPEAQHTIVTGSFNSVKYTKMKIASLDQELSFKQDHHTPIISHCWQILLSRKYIVTHPQKNLLHLKF
jgi:hypothetical protein